MLKNGQVWTATLDGKASPSDCSSIVATTSQLAWSPDGSALAFVSDRGDHGFIGVYRNKEDAARMARAIHERAIPLRVGRHDGKRIAFDAPAWCNGGPPEPWLSDVPHPWSIWTADAATGEGREGLEEPKNGGGLVPGSGRLALNLLWAEGDRLVFLAELDGWEHLYSVRADGGAPILLTPGAFMVEDVGV